MAVLYRIEGQRALRAASFGPQGVLDGLPSEVPSWRLAREGLAIVPVVGRGPAAPESAIFTASLLVSSIIAIPVIRMGEQIGAIVLADPFPRDDIDLDELAIAFVCSRITDVLSPPMVIPGPTPSAPFTIPPELGDISSWPVKGGNRDPVTGLPDRRMIAEPMARALIEAKRDGTGLAVVLLALDRFQRIDDWLGRVVGDELLRQVSERLIETLVDGDLIGRGSGEEFVMVLKGRPRDRSSLAFADRFVQVVREPFHVHGYDLSLSGCVGVSRFPEDADDAQRLLRFAGMALHRAKAFRQRGRVVCFTDDLREAVEQRGDLERHLRRALGAGELLLHYQPKIDLRQRRTTGVEALIRWNRNDTLVSPGAFLPVAEESELIVPIGTWVLLEACRQLVSWQKAGLGIDSVSVNVSAQQFGRADFVGTVERVLVSAGLAPYHLELEVTETSIMESIDEAVEKLAALRSMGVKVSVDDFGTGYSSLAYLQKLPVDVLKIDRAFIKNLDAVAKKERSQAHALADAITVLGHSLGLKVLAEGVETDGQLDAVCALGCDEVQGFYFSKPLAHADVPAFLMRSAGGVRPAN